MNHTTIINPKDYDFEKAFVYYRTPEEEREAYEIKLKEVNTEPYSDSFSKKKCSTLSLSEIDRKITLERILVNNPKCIEYRILRKYFVSRLKENPFEIGDKVRFSENRSQELTINNIDGDFLSFNEINSNHSYTYLEPELPIYHFIYPLEEILKKYQSSIYMSILNINAKKDWRDAFLEELIGRDFLKTEDSTNKNFKGIIVKNESSTKWKTRALLMYVSSIFYGGFKFQNNELIFGFEENSIKRKEFLNYEYAKKFIEMFRLRDGEKY